MKATCLLVVLLVLRAGCQAIVSPNSTLGQALLGNSSLDPDHSRALLATF